MKNRTPNFLMSSAIHGLTALMVVLAFLAPTAAQTALAATGTFSNTSPIQITGPTCPCSAGPATPYPSNISVSGVSGLVSKVTVTLNNLSHTGPDNIDVLLVGPAGQNIVIMSDAGGFNTLSNVNLTFDDAASTSLPDNNAITSGTYLPSNYVGGDGATDSFSSPAPARTGALTLATFNGTNPNGTWSLYVFDDSSGDAGSMAGGWTLNITTAVAEATSTSVTSSLNPSFTSTPNNSVTFTATVIKGSDGTAVTSGSVTFKEGTTVLQAATAVNGSGQATFTTTSLSEGSHVITAEYSGDASFGPSSGSVTQVVDNHTNVTGNNYCNTGTLTIPTSGSATPYPSHIFVSGVTGNIGKVTADLKGVTHTFPDDIDVLLVGPAGQNLILMSDAGSSNAISGVNLTFDDAASVSLPDNALITSGTYKPTDYVSGDSFPSPAPSPSGATTLATFNGTNPNGTWSLYVVDDRGGDAGSIAGGWCVTIVPKQDTTTTITSDSPDSSVVGQAVTVQYSVAPATSGTPTGNVTVSDGTQSCTGTVAAGQCAITFTSAGTKSLTATYAGDTNFNGSTSAAEPHQVNSADTTTAITSDNPDSSVVGQPVTVQYNVTVNAPGSGIPTGNVTVSDGTQSCTGTVAAGQCTITFTSAGTKSLTASYAGNSNFNSSTSAAEPHQVNNANTSTAITSDNPDPSNGGQAVAVNYSVTVNAPGTGIPTGNVTVSDGVDSCTGTVAAGTCDITLTTTGARTLTATYAGDSNFNGSTSAGASHTVNGNPTTTTITSDSPDSSVVGQSVTVQYAVTAASGTPSGNVTVSDGTISCTGSVAAGQCSLTFTSAGAKSLTATYAGDSDFSGSTSAAEPHQVNQADTTTTITSDTPDPSAQGSAVTVNYSVAVTAPGAGIPTGNVTVSDGVDSCTGTVAAGQCSITLTTAGARTLTASYAGDSNFNGSTSAAESHSVLSPPTVTINQASGQSDPTSGSPIHFTAVFGHAVTGFTDSDITLSGTAGATTAVVTQIAPNNGTTYDVAVSGMTTDGTVIATIPTNVATDAAGNVNTASSSTDNTVTFIADSTPPDTTITANPTNPTGSTSASFSFTGSDNQTPTASLTFQCKLDGGGFAACTSPKSYSGLALGSHTFQVRAIDGAGNIDPNPASFTWEIHAVTTLLYNGGQIVNVGSSLTLSAQLSSSAAACVSLKTVTFSVDDNPATSTIGDGPYVIGTATTNGSGLATLTIAGSTTSGWQEGVYILTARFAGTSSCDPSSDQATLTVASPGEAANGGGWYTLSGSGRVNFGFTVRKVDSKCTSNCAYKGQLVLINNGKWRLKGNLTTYSKTSNGQGAASGTGDLYWWNTSLKGGLGDWALAQSGVSYTVNFYDSGKSGKSSTDAFGIRIAYTPVAPQPSSLPNSTQQVLKGGDIKVS